MPTKQQVNPAPLLKPLLAAADNYDRETFVSREAPPAPVVDDDRACRHYLRSPDRMLIKRMPDGLSISIQWPARYDGEVRWCPFCGEQVGKLMQEAEERYERQVYSPDRQDGTDANDNAVTESGAGHR